MNRYSRAFLFPILFVLSLGFTTAQERKEIDSLLTITNSSKQDTTIGGAYVDLSELWFGVNKDSFELYTGKALAIANKGIKSGEESKTKTFLDIKASALNNLGAQAYMQGQINEAINYYTQSVELAKQIGDLGSLGSTYNNIGAAYEHQGNDFKALEYLEKSLTIQKQVGNKKDIASSLGNIGYILQEQGNITKALSYFEEAMRLEEEVNDKVGLAGTLHNIASIYSSQEQKQKAQEYYEKSLQIATSVNASKQMGAAQNNLGSLHQSQGDLAKAKDYFEQCYTNYEKAGYKRGAALALTNIGNTLLREKKMGEAIAYYNKSREIYKEINYKKGIVFTSIDIGNVFLREGDLKSAVESGKEALLIANELKTPEEIKDAAAFLQKVYQQKKSWEEAFEMSLLYIQMHDSIQNDKTKETVLKQQMKYEYEKEEALKQAEHNKQIEMFRQQQKFTTYKAYFLAIILLFGALIAVLLINRQRIKIKKQQEAHALEQKLAQNQLEKNKLEKENLEANLKLNQEKLNHITELFREKSRLIDKMEEQLEKAQAENPEEKNVKQLLTNIEEYINPNQYWEEFITSFKLVNQTFFDTLLKNFPDLTKTETRLCALIKCNLGNKEIANILHITPDSVKKSRNRLRKKLQLEADDSLTEYILFMN